MKQFKLFLKCIINGFINLVAPGLAMDVTMEALDINYRKKRPYLILFILGLLIGLFLAFLIVTIIYDYWPLMIMMLFLGFMIGAIPRTIINGKRQFKKISNVILMIISLCALLGLSYGISKLKPIDFSLSMSYQYYIVLICIGILSAFLLFIPGLNIGIILMALGFYLILIDTSLMTSLVFVGIYLGSLGLTSLVLINLTKKLNLKKESFYLFDLAFLVVAIITFIYQGFINNNVIIYEQHHVMEIICGIICLISAFLIVIITYEYHKPNDERIDAMKKRHMFRLYYTIFTHLPLALKMYIKMRKELKQHLMSFEERYEFCGQIAAEVNKAGHIEVQITGRENLSKEATLYIVNHQGRYDGCCVLTALKDYPCTMISAKNRVDLPFFHEAFLLLDGEYVDKTDMRNQVKIIKNIGERLKQGTSFIAFIEGKYENNGNNLQEFHTGVLHPAYQSKCRIVPIVLYDTYKVYSVSSIKKIKPEAHILKPLVYEDYQNLTKNELADRLKSIMQNKLDEINMNKEDNKKEF